MSTDEPPQEEYEWEAEEWAQKIADAYLDARPGLVPTFLGFRDSLLEMLELRLLKLFLLQVPPEAWKFDGLEADGIDSGLADVEGCYGLKAGPRLGIVQWELGTVEMEEPRP